MLRGHRFFLICVAAAVLAPHVGAQEPAKVTDQPAHPERILADALWRNFWFGSDHPIVKESEAAAMLAAILKGGSMGGGSGWFRPGQSRYGWGWLAARHRIAKNGRIAQGVARSGGDV